MIQKISVTSILLFFTIIAFGQLASRDSLAGMKENLIHVIDSLDSSRKLINGNPDFILSNNPKWIDNNLSSKTYLQNYKWGTTYVVINQDSTFLYIHYGEGAYLLQKGKWGINDNVLTLIGIKKMAILFKLKMQKLDRIRYFFRDPFSIQLKYNHDRLILIDKESKK